MGSRGLRAVVSWIWDSRPNEAFWRDDGLVWSGRPLESSGLQTRLARRLGPGRVKGPKNDHF